MQTVKEIKQCVNKALIQGDVIKLEPMDVERMAKHLGFAVMRLNDFPYNVIAGMLLNMPDKMKQRVRSDKLIALNANHDANHQRFAIAHELGHFFMHWNICEDKENLVFLQTKDDEEGIEREACKFAAMLLMDEETFRQACREESEKGADSIKMIRELSIRFAVPQRSVQRRMKELEIPA